MAEHGRRPLLLDLFCGAGGAAMGYHDAGFHVIGVDLHPQPRYPFPFIQADAVAFMDEGRWRTLGRAVDIIHASPPCQRYSTATKRNGTQDAHPDLIGPVRELLTRTGLPWVIENVEGAPLRDPVLVCGTACLCFSDGYRLRRHRLFESTLPLLGTGCLCEAYSWMPVLDVTGGGPTSAPRTDGGGGRPHKGTAAQVRRIMGMSWATKAECNEAVPPSYTRWLMRPSFLGQLPPVAAAVEVS